MFCNVYCMFKSMCVLYCAELQDKFPAGDNKVKVELNYFEYKNAPMCNISFHPTALLSPL